MFSFKVAFNDQPKLVIASSPPPNIDTDSREPKVL